MIDGESWSSMGSHVEVSFVMLRMANPTVKVLGSSFLDSQCHYCRRLNLAGVIVTAMCSRFQSLPFGVFIASNGFIQPREE